MTRAVALTIAGSDPSGGAGLQADLKTFHQFGVYGEAVVTLVTVQNTISVSRVECLDAGLVTAQLRAVVVDIPPGAAKTGALGNAAIIEAVAAEAAGWRFQLVIDPVMVSKHGASLIGVDAVAALKSKLFPLAALVTPNLDETRALTGRAVTDLEGMRDAASAILDLGPKAVLIKGGHLVGPADDVLYDGYNWLTLHAERVPTPHTHGTGCTYSAAIAAGLAKGQPLVEAVAIAKRFITEAIRTNPGLGAGSGPVNHHAAV